MIHTSSLLSNVSLFNTIKHVIVCLFQLSLGRPCGEEASHCTKSASVAMEGKLVAEA